MSPIELANIVIQHHYLIFVIALIFSVLINYQLPIWQIRYHKLIKKKSLLTIRIDRKDFQDEHKQDIFRKMLHIKKFAMFEKIQEVANDVNVWRWYSSTELAEYIINQIENSISIENKQFDDFLIRNYDHNVKFDIVEILREHGYYDSRKEIMKQFYNVIYVIINNNRKKRNVQKMLMVFDTINTLLIDNFDMFYDVLYEINGRIQVICNVSIESRYQKKIESINKNEKYN